jgi:AcrR family transcriptional regulator
MRMTQVVSRIKDTALVARRRAQILAAARAVFREKGFHRATVRDIADQAKLTQGSLYNYVQAKEDILFLICDELVTQFQGLVREVVAAQTEPEERLQAAVRGVIEIIYAHQDDVLLMYHESHSLPRPALHSILSRVHDYIEDFATIVKLGTSTARLPVSNARLTANIITFLPMMLALRRWDLERCADRNEVVEELVAFMMRGLGSDKR